MAVFDNADRVDLWGALLQHALWGKFTLHAECTRCAWRGTLCPKGLRQLYAETERIQDIVKELGCPVCDAAGRMSPIDVSRTHHAGIRPPAPWLARRGLALRPFYLQVPPPIGELMRWSPRWFWAYCLDPYCCRGVALPIAPFVIRWGRDASSETLRRALRCRACGSKGVELRHPAAADKHGHEPFPTGGLP